MKEKGNESWSSSLVIVSRKMLIAGIAGTALFSFGLGYFFGYGGTTTTRVARQLETDNKIVPSEDRTVLDSSGKPTIVLPPATSGILTKESPPPIPRLNNGVAPAPKIQQELNESSEGKKPESIQTPEKKAPGEDAVRAEKKHNADLVDRKGDKKDSIAEEQKKQLRPAAKKAAHRSVSSKNRHVYEVQIGAFSDQAKAERLKDQLSARGFKASIKAFSPEPGKTLSSVRIGHYTTKKEAEELTSGLKSQGFEGVVVYGSR